MNDIQKLTHAITQWDIKQSTRRGYNPHGLAIMFAALEMAEADCKSGMPIRDALMTRFNDRLRDHLLKAIGLPVA